VNGFWPSTKVVKFFLINKILVFIKKKNYCKILNLTFFYREFIIIEESPSNVASANFNEDDCKVFVC